MKFKWSEPYLIPIYFWIIFMLAKYTNGNIFVLVIGRHSVIYTYSSLYRPTNTKEKME